MMRDETLSPAEYDRAWSSGQAIEDGEVDAILDELIGGADSSVDR